LDICRSILRAQGAGRRVKLKRVNRSLVASGKGRNKNKRIVGSKGCGQHEQNSRQNRKEVFHNGEFSINCVRRHIEPSNRNSSKFARHSNSKPEAVQILSPLRNRPETSCAMKRSCSWFSLVTVVTEPLCSTPDQTRSRRTLRRSPDRNA
jgi:hypothetical protein